MIQPIKSSSDQLRLLGSPDLDERLPHFFWAAWRSRVGGEFVK